MIKPGLYKHWKGMFYRVVMPEVALDDSVMGHRIFAVVYVPLYGDGQPCIRTVANFTEHINQDGYTGPRFRFVQE